LTVVVHQIRSPDNLGALARLMANFGYHHLVLSQPRTYTFRAAEKLAVHAESRLEDLQLAPDLESALESCVFACGTTSRAEVKGRTILTPEEGVARLAAASARGRVALVFGGEKRGLSDAELALCHEVLAIPTRAEQPSMNIAQAAAVLLYLSSREAPAPVELPEDAGARLATVHAVEDAAREVMLESGFLNPQAPSRVLHELSRSLVRGRLTQREAEMWLSAFEHLRRALKQWQHSLRAPPHR
jgi:tRNA/rRNA methyltransferase